MSITPKTTREQVTKSGTFADFGVDIEQDLIQGITGESKDERFGKTVTGKDALGVSVKVNMSNIKSFLKVCFEKYREDGYKEHFGWVDNISEVKNSVEVEILDKKLIDKIKNESLEKVWMSVPEVIAWEDVSEFKLKRDSFGNDLYIPQYLNFLSLEEKNNISVEVLKKQNIRCISASSQAEKHSWRVYDCLYCEAENTKGKTHILSNGKWYQIENDFLQEVSKSFDELRNKPTQLTLPECDQDEHEGDYSERVTSGNSSNICNMDKKVVQHGGTKQKVEFCDLFTKDKKIIHVKKYGASSVFSHLFSQGLVSGELFYLDPEFRKKLNDTLPDGYKLTDTEKNPDPSDYEVIFAIISKSEKDLDIPFFSKVNIKNAKKRLESFGYSVHLFKILTKK